VKIVSGNFLYALDDPGSIVAVPTNGVLTPLGLVMGAGPALAIARRQPGLQTLLADRIRQQGKRVGLLWRYGFVAVWVNERWYGAFQTKMFFQNPADIDLIQYSTERLAEFLHQYPGHHVHLALPEVEPASLESFTTQAVIQEALKDLPVYLYQSGITGNKTKVLAK
jgi:hypothetical protein